MSPKLNGNLKIATWITIGVTVGSILTFAFQVGTSSADFNNKLDNVAECTQTNKIDIKDLRTDVNGLTIKDSQNTERLKNIEKLAEENKELLMEILKKDK